MIMQQLEPGDLWAPVRFPGDPTVNDAFPARLVAAVSLSAIDSDTKLLIRAHASGTIVRESSGARAVIGSVLATRLAERRSICAGRQLRVPQPRGDEVTSDQ